MYTNYLNYSPPILVVSYTEGMLSRAMSVDLNIWVVGLLILSLFPSNEYDNAYGLSNCIEKVGSNFIRIDFGGFEKFLDEFSFNVNLFIRKYFTYNNTKKYILSFYGSYFLIWCFLYVLKVLIQRLHDSYSSAFWIFGLFIPYVNVYVIYLLLVKGSWQYIESSK